MTQAQLEAEWYARTGCGHSHCPRCLSEKPQPFLCADGRMLCGYCAAVLGTAVEVVPCRPDNCEEANP